MPACAPVTHLSEHMRCARVKPGMLRSTWQLRQHRRTRKMRMRTSSSRAGLPKLAAAASCAEIQLPGNAGSCVCRNQLMLFLLHLFCIHTAEQPQHCEHGCRSMLRRQWHLWLQRRPLCSSCWATGGSPQSRCRAGRSARSSPGPPWPPCTTCSAHAKAASHLGSAFWPAVYGACAAPMSGSPVAAGGDDIGRDAGGVCILLPRGQVKEALFAGGHLRTCTH